MFPGKGIKFMCKTLFAGLKLRIYCCTRELTKSSGRRFCRVRTGFNTFLCRSFCILLNSWETSYPQCV